MDKKGRKKLNKTISNMLKESGVNNYDDHLPDYILQIATKFVQDATLNANELAKNDDRSEINKEDTALVNKLREINGINQQEMLQYYDEINSKPLPLITERNGILLPQEGQLINTNYQLKRATHQDTGVHNYKIPIKIITSGGGCNPQRCLEVVQFVEQTRQNQYVEYLKKVFLRRNCN